MSALSIRGSESLFDVRDGMVPFGLIATYEGSKLLPVTGRDHLVVGGRRVSKVVCTKIDLLQRILVWLEALFFEGEVGNLSPLRSGRCVEGEL
jgi:hypothetical protein